jgi:O-antigen/teichoic acid export membrane protein
MFKPALTIMAGRTFGYAVLFVLPLILVRIFNQAEFGTYKQVFLLYGTILNLAQMGMSENLFYFIPGAGKDEGRYVCNSILALWGIGLLSAVFLFAGGDMIADSMNNDALAPLMPLLALFFLLMLASYVLEIVMTARHEYKTAAVSYGLSDITRLVVIVIPVLVYRTVASVLYGLIVFAALRIGTTLWYCSKQFGATLRPSWPLLMRQAAYSLPFALYVLFQTGQQSLHQFMVSSLFDTATFAVYAVGCFQVPLVEVISTSVVNVMMVGMVQALREERNTAVLAMWQNTVRQLGLVFIPLVTLLLVAGHDLIIFLFTDAYAASVPIFRIWLFAILFAIIPMDGLLRVYAQTQFLLVINVARFILVAGGMYWFVSEMGLIGAVSVTLVALVAGKAMGLMRMIACGHLTVRTVLPWRDLFDIALISGAAALPAWWITTHLEASLFARLAVTAMIYGLAYSALAVVCGVIRKNELDTVFRWIQPWLHLMSMKTLFMR